MTSKAKILLIIVAAAVLGGCAGVRTGNGPADAAIYTALGVAEAKTAAQRQDQRAFESDLAKVNSKGK